MKASDLMIGDWVLFNEKPAQIVGIRNDMDGAYARTTAKDVWYPVETFEPIPLTEDILIKNGYKRDKHQCYYPIFNNPEGDFMTVYFVLRSGDGQWFMGVDTGAYESPCFAHCDYVHKFQHLLRDIDEDKELEL